MTYREGGTSALADATSAEGDRAGMITLRLGRGGCAGAIGRLHGSRKANVGLQRRIRSKNISCPHSAEAALMANKRYEILVKPTAFGIAGYQGSSPTRSHTPRGRCISATCEGVEDLRHTSGSQTVPPPFYRRDSFIA